MSTFNMELRKANYGMVQLAIKIEHFEEKIFSTLLAATRNSGCVVNDRDRCYWTVLYVWIIGIRHLSSLYQWHISCLDRRTHVKKSSKWRIPNSNRFPLFKEVLQGSCVGPVLFIVYNYDIMDGVSNLHSKHLFADDLAVILSPSASWPPKVVIPQPRILLAKVIEYLVEYSPCRKNRVKTADISIDYRTIHGTIHHDLSPMFSLDIG